MLACDTVGLADKLPVAKVGMRTSQKEEEKE